MAGPNACRLGVVTDQLVVELLIEVCMHHPGNRMISPAATTALRLVVNSELISVISTPTTWNSSSRAACTTLATASLPSDDKATMSPRSAFGSNGSSINIPLADTSRTVAVTGLGLRLNHLTGCVDVHIISIRLIGMWRGTTRRSGIPNPSTQRARKLGPMHSALNHALSTADPSRRPFPYERAFEPPGSGELCAMLGRTGRGDAPWS